MPRWSSELYSLIEQRHLDFLINTNGERSPEVIAHELGVTTEILKRDFTKRQLNMIAFICIFSFPYNKKTAVIRNMQDFELCGVSKTKVRDELNKLCELNVILWDKDSKEFSINDPKYWEVPFHNNYSDKRYQQMFIENLDHAGVDVSEMIERLERLKG
ncbi:replication protein [Bacillus haynesii]|uniref:replication protein n=1 Tax=Bacillus haynesii TaxID=1925021 RepID=UPI00227F500A|nr:replication protein [Bacillus haynesii]MCY7861086.1 replication protein [Bacillus haynesii]MCY8015585.1 replication protein [Bacillus haynesii]MCY8291583.1 replication protein [Bacillus haynesii]MCY8549208.1 replication protein [Bacillus haynesii]